MAYKPNLWLINALHRSIVAAARQFTEYSFLLRPTRRHIFIRMFKLPEDTYVPSFFRPCFAILAKKDDPDKKPCLVIETEDPGREMRDLYEQHGVLWVLVQQEENRFALECCHGGTRLTVEEQTGSLFKLLCAPLAWSERHVSFPQGSYIHSHSERVLRDAVKILSPSYRIEVHHQVPLSYVLGFKDDLSRKEQTLLNREIDAVITQSFDADPDCAVILPIKLDLHESHRTDQKVKDRDKHILDLCCRFQVPLLTITPSRDEYVFSCLPLNVDDKIADTQEPEAWAGALAPFLGASIRYAGRSF